MARNNDFITNVDRQVGRKIHDFRIASGMSRQILAKAVGITHQQLAKYEHGVNRISIGRLILIAKELGEPITAFCCDIDLGNNTPLSKERITIEMANYFMNIKNSKVKEAITNLIKVVSK